MLVDQLRTLEASGLVRLAATQPELEYLFRHALVHDATYESLTRQDRKQLHLAVGRALEALYSERLEELAPLLAEHFDRAGDEARALRYFTLAGDAAARVYANEEAVAHYGRAQAIARRMLRRDASALEREQIVHLYSGRDRAIQFLGRFDEALANDEELERLGEELGDREMRLAGLNARILIYSTPTAQFDSEQGKAIAAQAIELARELGNGEAEAKITWSLMLLHMMIGEEHAALRYGEQSLQMARHLGLREQLAFTLNDMATYAYSATGQPQRALAAWEEAQAIWREQGNLAMLADNLCGMAFYYHTCGEFDRAQALADEAYEMSRRIGNLWGISYSLGMSGITLLERGELDRALPAIAESIRTGEQVNALPMQVIPRNMLAFHFGWMRAIRQGLDVIESARRIGESQLSFWKAAMFGTLALLRVMSGDLPAAEQALEESRQSGTHVGWQYTRVTIEIATFELGMARGEHAQVARLAEDFARRLTENGVLAFVAYARYFQAQALRRQGPEQAGEAYAALLEARAGAEATGSRLVEWRILAALAEVEAERGQNEQARALRKQAREIIEFLTDHIGDAEVRESFLGLPEVQGLLPRALQEPA